MYIYRNLSDYHTHPPNPPLPKKYMQRVEIIAPHLVQIRIRRKGKTKKVKIWIGNDTRPNAKQPHNILTLGCAGKLPHQPSWSRRLLKKRLMRTWPIEMILWSTSLKEKKKKKKNPKERRGGLIFILFCRALSLAVGRKPLRPDVGRMAKLGLCKREGNSRVGRWQAYRFSYPERLKSRSLHGCPSNHQALLVLLWISICLFLPSRKSWWRVCCHVNCLVSIQRTFVYGGFILSSIRFQRFF